MSALLRVLRAPWLWLTIGLIQLILAAALALPLRLAVRVAMGPFMIADEGRILAPLLELITDQRPVLAALAATLAGSALLALLIAPLLAGAVITRLAGPQPRGELARAAFTHLPTNFVIGIYGLVLRVLLALVAAALGSLHPLLRPLGLLLGLTFAALAVDLARAHVVLHGDVGTALRTGHF